MMAAYSSLFLEIVMCVRAILVHTSYYRIGRNGLKFASLTTTNLESEMAKQQDFLPRKLKSLNCSLSPLSSVQIKSLKSPFISRKMALAYQRIHSFHS
jgi:hypothetical protein